MYHWKYFKEINTSSWSAVVFPVCQTLHFSNHFCIFIRNYLFIKFISILSPLNHTLSNTMRKHVFVSVFLTTLYKQVSSKLKTKLTKYWTSKYIDKLRCRWNLTKSNAKQYKPTEQMEISWNIPDFSGRFFLLNLVSLLV